MKYKDILDIGQREARLVEVIVSIFSGLETMNLFTDIVAADCAK